MKAQVLHDVADLRYEEVSKPQLKKGWVLVKVKAAGVCGSDIPRIYKTGAHVHPLIPGHEFSGQVVDIYDESLEKGLAYSRLFRVGNVIHAIKSNMRCAKITTISVQDVMVDSQNM